MFSLSIRNEKKKDLLFSAENIVTLKLLWDLHDTFSHNHML